MYLLIQLFCVFNFVCSIIAVGGDGTFSHVVNNVLLHSLSICVEDSDLTINAHPITFGVLPNGAYSDWYYRKIISILDMKGVILCCLLNYKFSHRLHIEN